MYVEYVSIYTFEQLQPSSSFDGRDILTTKLPKTTSGWPRLFDLISSAIGLLPFKSIYPRSKGHNSHLISISSAAAAAIHSHKFPSDKFFYFRSYSSLLTLIIPSFGISLCYQFLTRVRQSSHLVLQLWWTP